MEVFSENGIHDNLEDNLYVGGVGCCGEVWVDHLTREGTLLLEQLLDVAGGAVHILVRTCNSYMGAIFSYQVQTLPDKASLHLEACFYNACGPDSCPQHIPRSRDKLIRTDTLHVLKVEISDMPTYLEREQFIEGEAIVVDNLHLLDQRALPTLCRPWNNKHGPILNKGNSRCLSHAVLVATPFYLAYTKAVKPEYSRGQYSRVILARVHLGAVLTCYSSASTSGGSTHPQQEVPDLSHTRESLVRATPGCSQLSHTRESLVRATLGCSQLSHTRMFPVEPHQRVPGLSHTRMFPIEPHQRVPVPATPGCSQLSHARESLVRATPGCSQLSHTRESLVFILFEKCKIIPSSRILTTFSSCFAQVWICLSMSSLRARAFSSSWSRLRQEPIVTLRHANHFLCYDCKQLTDGATKVHSQSTNALCWIAFGVLQEDNIQIPLKPGREYTVSIEGNIGCGKTTLLEYFKSSKVVEMLERSLFSTKHCFVENDFRNGTINGLEYAILNEWFNYLTEMPRTGIDLIVYLRADPKVCFDRIKRRSRKEEAGVPYKLIDDLHNLHEEWLVQQICGKLPAPVLVLDANNEYNKMTEIYEEKRHEILCGIKA
ncbi:KITM-like protein [Mya arenaria]|uniref:KITM-like protein n=1 Tax=Mya arenaria TaxID=6604 RepID=A0ABY7DKR3_MYAAR|nr:KITM-like protein [Mya arenaria]